MIRYFVVMKMEPKIVGSRKVETQKYSDYLSEQYRLEEERRDSCGWVFGSLQEPSDDEKYEWKDIIESRPVVVGIYKDDPRELYLNRQDGFNYYFDYIDQDDLKEVKIYQNFDI